MLRFSIRSGYRVGRQIALQMKRKIAILIISPAVANQGAPIAPRQFSLSGGPAPTLASSKNHGGGLANTLGDLVRFEFAGSVETHLVGPKYDGNIEAEDDSVQHPLVELDQPFFLSSRALPSLYVGVDYDFGQMQRKWHGVACLSSRLRFRPTHGVAFDVSRTQFIDNDDVPSATTLRCSWKDFRSSLRTTSQCSSLLLSIPVVPSRLHWDCSLSSRRKLSDTMPLRSGWVVDATGQIQGSQKFEISPDLNARCSLRRRIRWVDNEEEMVESTHVGLSLQHRHGDQGCTMVSFAAQLEQIQDSAQFRVRHDVAIGGVLSTKNGR